jgi:hypothetical protein
LKFGGRTDRPGIDRLAQVDAAPADSPQDSAMLAVTVPVPLGCVQSTAAAPQSLPVIN